MLDMHLLMAKLSRQRPLFHSEADFQHSLAWTIHEKYPDISIRLEYPVQQAEKRIHVDIWLIDGNHTYAIELKYGTTLFQFVGSGESYDLRNQSADDLIRYAFCKDIERLENLKSTGGTTGYAIFLSNYPPFWSPSSTGRITTYEEFRIHEGVTLSGERKWATHAGPGTTKGIGAPIGLQGEYAMHWTEYSQMDGPKGEFRYLLIEV